jgi:hypothetical protein
LPPSSARSECDAVFDLKALARSASGLCGGATQAFELIGARERSRHKDRVQRNRPGTCDFKSPARSGIARGPCRVARSCVTRRPCSAEAWGRAVVRCTRLSCARALSCAKGFRGRTRRLALGALSRSPSRRETGGSFGALSHGAIHADGAHRPPPHAAVHRMSPHAAARLRPKSPRRRLPRATRATGPRPPSVSRPPSVPKFRILPRRLRSGPPSFPPDAMLPAARWLRSGSLAATNR